MLCKKCGGLIPEQYIETNPEIMNDCERHPQLGRAPYPIEILKFERSDWKKYLENVGKNNSYDINTYGWSHHFTEDEIKERYILIDKSIKILDRELREYYK